MFFSVFFVIFLNLFNYGIFSLTLLLFYILGFYWIVRATNKTVVIFENKWYNTIKNLKHSNKGKKKNEISSKG